MHTFKHNVSLADYTTLKVGGPAEFFATVASETELLDVLTHARNQKLSVRLIGGGSNVLAPDEGLRGITIHNLIPGWDEVSEKDRVIVTVGSGETLDKIIEYAVSKSYWGLENLSHIPGSVGATPVQNVGAYGVEIASCIRAVRAVHTETLESINFEAAKCGFGYRNSFFKSQEGKKYLITSVTMELSLTPNPKLSYRDLKDYFSKKQSPSIKEIRDAVIEIRSRKFPDWRKTGTAGSFFKNPIVSQNHYKKLQNSYPEIPGYEVAEGEVKVPLAWVLDNVCKLRGVQKGNVGTFEGQALVLVNVGGATASEINSFASYVTNSVYEKTGIQIEWEVTKLG